MCWTGMVTEGLPVPRQEHGTEDLIAGADFLSLVDSHPVPRQPHLSNRKTSSSPSSPNEIANRKTTPSLRLARSTETSTRHPVLQFGAKKLKVLRRGSNPLRKHSSVVSVRVSSSVRNINRRRTTTTPTTTTTPQPPAELNAIISEDPPNIVAQASKSEFSVEESEPITSNDSYDPSLQQRHYVAVDNSKELIRGRSVSYSAVIQALPQQPNPYARQDRHYAVKDRPHENEFDKSNKRFYPPSGSVAESNDYIVTQRYNYNQQPTSEANWEKPEERYVPEQSTEKQIEPTETNWEVSEEHYAESVSSSSHRTPVIYGKPEENYEVDESVSVMTNGKVHGVQAQPSTPSLDTSKTRDKSKSDNQKVGYVVEGRNYRKYRVEERTSDGFIVGEYGVVSHDDGSLRGVRYTADGTTNPRLIYDALMKFLSL